MDVKIILAIVLLVIMALGIAVPIATDLTSQATTIQGVTNETLGSCDGKLPIALTTDHARVVTDSDSLLIYNGTASATKALVRDANYTVTNYEDGQFSIIDLQGMNKTNCKVNATYGWTYSNYVGDNTSANAMVLLIPLALVLFVLVYIFGVFG